MKRNSIKGFSITAIFFFLIAASALYYIFKEDSGGKWPPGVLVDSEPVQTNLTAQHVIELKGHTIVKKAEFGGLARVLSTERYFFDDSAELVPVDLALGWKKMSDQSVIDQLKISQSRRFYYWKTRGNDYPAPREDIEQSSANMHMIPSTDEIERTLKVIEKGDIIKFQGYLVDISRKDGFSRFSSVTRNDTGPGACEIILLTSISIERTP